MAGDMVICCMGPTIWTAGGHFILWYATLADIPKGSRPAIERLMTVPGQDDPARMVLVGDNGCKEDDSATITEKTIRVDETFCRVATVLYCAGKLG